MVSLGTGFNFMEGLARVQADIQSSHSHPEASPILSINNKVKLNSIFNLNRIKWGQIEHQGKM